MGSEDRCPCKRFKPTEFQKIIDLQDVGLTVYRHVQRNRNEDPTRILLEITNSDDVYILQNKNDFDLTSADFVPEFENNKIHCPQCHYVVEHVRRVLQSVPIIRKNAIRGICNHCRTRLQSRMCQKCEESVKKFAVIKAQPLFYDKETSTRVNVWLRKVQFVFENVVAGEKSFGDLDLYEKGQICSPKKYKSDVAVTLDVNNTQDTKKQNVPLIKSLSDGSLNIVRKNHVSVGFSETYKTYESSRVSIPNMEQNASKLVDQNKLKFFLTPSKNKKVTGRSDSILLKTSRKEETFDSKEDKGNRIINKQLPKLHEGNTGINEETKMDQTGKQEKVIINVKMYGHTQAKMQESWDGVHKHNQSIEELRRAEKHERKARRNYVKRENALEGANVLEKDLKSIKKTRENNKLTKDQVPQKRYPKNTIEMSKKDNIPEKKKKHQLKNIEQYIQLKIEESHDKVHKHTNQPTEKLRRADKQEEKSRSNYIKEGNALEGANVLDKDLKSIKKTREKNKFTPDQVRQEKCSKNLLEINQIDNLLENKKKEKNELKNIEKFVTKEPREKAGNKQNQSKVSLVKENDNIKENNNAKRGEIEDSMKTNNLTKAKNGKATPTEKHEIDTKVTRPDSKAKSTKNVSNNNKDNNSTKDTPVIDLRSAAAKKVRNKKDKSDRQNTQDNLKESPTKMIKKKKDYREKKVKTTDYPHENFRSMTNIERNLVLEQVLAKHKKSFKLKSNSEPNIFNEQYDIPEKVTGKVLPNQTQKPIKISHPKVEDKQRKVNPAIYEKTRIGKNFKKKVDDIQTNHIKTKSRIGSGIGIVIESQKKVITSNKKFGKQEKYNLVNKKQSGNKLKRFTSSDRKDFEGLITFLHQDLKGNKDGIKTQNIISKTIKKLPIVTKHLSHNYDKSDCIICDDSDVNLDFEEWKRKKPIDRTENEYVKGTRIYKTRNHQGEKEIKNKLNLQKSEFLKSAFPIQKKELRDYVKMQANNNDVDIHSTHYQKSINGEECDDDKQCNGTIRYALSDRQFIEKGWTLLPVEKYFRKEYTYSSRPAYPELNWFKRNRSIEYLTYSTGEKLAEIDQNGCGRWYYKNGRLALDYYDSEDSNAKQRIVIYSSGEVDRRGGSFPVTVLASFDYNGNGIVFDHCGKIRLKYNQTEGVILDREIGPLSRWKWHSLYEDPPVLQRVMMDTHLNDPKIREIGDGKDSHRSKETMQEDDHEPATKLDINKNIGSGKLFVPYQIKTKAFKINDQFSLRIIDQTKIHILFGDGPKPLKFNIGMILNHEEIVGIENVEVGQILNSMDEFPATSGSVHELQSRVAKARKRELALIERQRLLNPDFCAITDRPAS